MSAENTQKRPVSRRGQGARFESATMDTGRPQTAARPATAMRPPSVRAPPSTATRLNTGLIPKTGMAMNLADRPITQQGLSGLRTGTAQGHRRQVLDKRYFEGLLRQKMKMISMEVRRLKGQIEEQRQHEATTDLYDARVKEVAQDLTALQGELADYNQVLDRMHTGGNVADIMAETDDIRADNTRNSSRLEQLYQQNRDLEEQIQQLEVHVQNEKNTAQRLIEDMKPEERDRFEELKSNNEQLLAEISDQQQQLEKLKALAASLQDKISGSQIKQEAVLLYQKLREREERKAQLEEELRRKATPAQEREQLLQRVREDNSEMGAMERQMTQIKEQLKAIKQEIELVEQDLDESHTDRHHKLKELRQREETMDNFLASFDESRDTEQDRIQVLEGKVEVALQHMATNLHSPGAIPSKNEFAVMRETLTMKQDELEKSKMTAEELAREETKLKDNVLKVEELEDKIRKEILSLKDQLEQMKEEMRIFSDLDTLRNTARDKREELAKQRDALLARKVPSEKLDQLKIRHEELHKQLNENDTYVQLHSLEKKLQLLEETNETLKSQMMTKKAELDFETQRKEAMQILNSYNQLLQKRYTNRL